MTERQQLIAAMRLWRKSHPEFTDAKVVHHGWFGHCVMAYCRSEYVCAAQVSEVLKEYAQELK